MNTVVYEIYGIPDVQFLKELEKPISKGKKIKLPNG